MWSSFNEARRTTRVYICVCMHITTDFRDPHKFDAVDLFERAFHFAQRAEPVILFSFYQLGPVCTRCVCVCVYVYRNVPHRQNVSPFYTSLDEHNGIRIVKYGKKNLGEINKTQCKSLFRTLLVNRLRDNSAFIRGFA